jgi:DnaJ-domain-containing protein 1
VHDERRDVCFDAVSEEDKYEWIRFITRAAVGPVNAPVTVHTYYEALGLDESATENEVKKAYRKLALRNHPDKGGDAAAFAKIGEAYEVLCAIKEQAAEEAEDFDEIRATLRRDLGGGLGFTLKGAGTAPLARMSLADVKPEMQAHQNGLRDGDTIVQVDDHGVRGLAFADTLKYMQGAAGGPVQLLLVCLRSKLTAATAPASPVSTPASAPASATADVPPSAAAGASRSSQSQPTPTGNTDAAPPPAETAAAAAEPEAPLIVDSTIVKQGWVWRKWKTGGLRRRWERCYFAVRGCFLYYYEDPKTNPTGMLALKDAAAQFFKHHTRQFTFEVSHEERRPLLMSCRDEDDRHEWVKAIASASLGPANAPAGRSAAELCEVLGLSADAVLDDIRRAFRKLALKCHPDKGGDPQQFQRITEAYEVMVALLETAEQEAEDFDTIRVALERQPGESLGIHLEGRGKSPLCRVSVRALVEGKVGTTCGRIAEGDIVVEVDGVGVRGLDFAEVLRRMRGVVGLNRLELTFLRKKLAAAVPAPAAPAPTPGRGGRKQSWFQQVNAEVAQGTTEESSAAGANAPAPAQPTAPTGGRRKMSWLQRVEKQCHESDEAHANASGGSSGGLGTVAEEEFDDDDDDNVAEKVVEDDDDEAEGGADHVPEMARLPRSPAQSAGRGRRKQSFLQQVEMEVQGEVSGAASVGVQPSSVAPAAVASPAKAGRRKASWLARSGAAAPSASGTSPPGTLVFDEMLEQSDATAAPSSSTTGPRKRSWLPRTLSSSQPHHVAPSSAQPATIAEENGCADNDSGGSDSDSEFGGISAAEANEALNRLASMHGVAQRASWIDTSTKGRSAVDAAAATAGAAVGSKSPDRRVAPSVRLDEGLLAEQDSADPFPSMGTPTPRTAPSQQGEDGALDDAPSAPPAQLDGCPPLNWRLIWSQRFRLLYLLCRLPKEAGAQSSSLAVPALRAV